MSEAIRILHLSTHDEDCGIGKYQEMFLDAMQIDDSVRNEFFEISPSQIKVMNKKNYEAAFSKLEERLKEFDVLHIQHEFSFYFKNELELAVKIARTLRKKVIVTIHTSANIGNPSAHINGYGIRSFARRIKAAIRKKQFEKNFINPLKLVDLILVHNDVTAQSLVERGVPRDIIQKIIIPVPKVDFRRESNEINENLRSGDKDVIYATVGFLHRYKGIEEAIKALQFLPSNYKLAIVGGLHSGTDNTKIYDKVADLIASLDLQERVYITGYVKEDERMNALIRECDVCVYPYDKFYYSNVSSAALNNALANYMPTVAYPTASFTELNKIDQTMVLTENFAYYELARELKRLNIAQSAQKSQKYALKHSYDLLSQGLIETYKSVVR